ncbi:IS110 family transposase [Planomonospora sp. ID67723]|uniref:IS110 family transposase n=1 Tax=Planomonospora sp. ID67723 TaxID=2738134 RepID=UPI001A1B098B|nr:IS110 family transposase [Planomonospora sp. ID67723]MBG0831752.1 IS110 family transposase [Planomonospora sp. ID67723]
MKITCGIDWAEKHHDIALIDENGALIAKRRISETVDGFNELLSMLAEAGDSPQTPIPIAIETPRGLLIAALRAAGRQIYPINPMAVARYRERHPASGKKSDHADAMVLANILRTDAHVHRPLPADTELARSIKVLARACQDATWRRTRAGNELRSLLREYYPAMLEAAANRSGSLHAPLTRALLQLAPTPAAALKVSQAKIAAALRRAGRLRHVEEVAAELHAILRRPHLRQDPLVEHAMGVQALRLLATLSTECESIEQLSQATEEAFRQHPDYEIITSFPGIADQAGARILAEIGDDRTRFTSARSLKAFAGSAPVTRASGRSLVVSCRRIKNDRLAAVGFTWGLSTLNLSPGARAHYDRRRATGDGHAAAFRNLFNRFLYHCLHKRLHHNETLAFPPTVPAAA